MLIDGLQYANWSEKIFRQMKEGGVNAVHVTISYHENFRETVLNFEQWNRWFEQFPDLIMKGQWASDIDIARETGRTAIFFGFQNPAPIEDDIGLVEIVHTLGARFMQLTYNNQSLLATGCYESEDPGITRMGKQVIKEMNRVGLVVDMSHSADRSTIEAAEISERPIAITHANPYEWSRALRNKKPEVIQAVTENGGMLGFSMYPHHLKDKSDCTLASFCEMIARTADKYGAEHLGIGTDLCQDQPDSIVEWMRVGRWSKEIDYGEGSASNPGFPPMPPWFEDNRHFGNIEQGLRDTGMNDEEVAGIMGKNWYRFFRGKFRTPKLMNKLVDIVRRPPPQVMRLKRLGSFHQCRLSFMRTLTRRLARENWTFTRPKFDIDANGVGRAVYTATGPNGSYSLVAFAHDLPPEKRSDRVIAEAWDATFTLFDGTPSEDDIARLSKNVPYQEAGRVSENELTLARANRSVRLWAHFVDALANGRQPDQDLIDKVGYLMRTTAVYGSGKFGLADREKIAEREEMAAPFQAELLTVYLIRTFVLDLVQHMAQAVGGDKTATLDKGIATGLGIGNSTGLGMAPFIINHPVLFNNWIAAREEAILRVCSIETASGDEVRMFRELLLRTRRSVDLWHSEHPIQIEKLRDLNADLAAFEDYAKTQDLVSDFPWHRLCEWAKNTLTEEGQELVSSLILEPYGHLVDELSPGMSDKDKAAFRIDGSMPTGAVRSLIETCFGWALDRDWSETNQCARAWYVSEEKLEPRMGERFEEPIADYEQPLAPARDAAALHSALSGVPDDAPISEFLLDHPEYRHTVRRAQMSKNAPYGEIHDNTIGDTLLPIDMLRAKLSFFGATHFDPRSDRWVRICMYAGAPYPADLKGENADLWVYPETLA